MYYYDKKGNPITWEKWLILIQDGFYQRIADETILPDGKWVSTVWLGLDHNFGASGQPIIFETMVFPGRGLGGDLDCLRYSTEADALTGHKEMVEKWTNNPPSRPIPPCPQSPIPEKAVRRHGRHIILDQER